MEDRKDKRSYYSAVVPTQLREDLTIWEWDVTVSPACRQTQEASETRPLPALFINATPLPGVLRHAVLINTTRFRKATPSRIMYKTNKKIQNRYPLASYATPPMCQRLQLKKRCKVTGHQKSARKGDQRRTKRSLTKEWGTVRSSRRVRSAGKGPLCSARTYASGPRQRRTVEGEGSRSEYSPPRYSPFAPPPPAPYQTRSTTDTPFQVDPARTFPSNVHLQ